MPALQREEIDNFVIYILLNFILFIIISTFCYKIKKD